MKRFLMGFALLLATLPTWAEQVSLSEARQLATPYMKQGVKPQMVKRKAMARTDAEFQPLYVFSRGEGQGFVLVSGDDRMPAILGFTESGDFDEDQLPIQLQDMIAYYTKVAEQLQEGTIEGIQGLTTPRKASGTRDIATLMTSHHHQSWPYNNRCPYIKDTTNRAVTGCVATAASQIIYYWRKDLDDRTKYATPTYGYGDAPVTESIPSGTPLKWDLMYDSYASGDPAESIEAISTFVACVGTSAWLTYGSSTSGQIDNCRQVFSGQFGMNGGTTVWKWNYGQTAWEKLIIQDLEKGFPILYSGVHPSNGGHAVVIDGYRLRDNLFHFNFGWGGQGDGYFTVDDATGMNGFNDSQGMVHNIYPRKYRMSGELSFPQGEFMSRVENTIKAKVTNNSTIAQKGIYLFCMTGTSTPTSSSTAAGSDTKTVIEVGETAGFTFTYSPSGTSTYTIYLCDANRNVLDKISGVTTTASVPDLTLNSLTPDDGGTSEPLTLSDGTSIEVKHIYNSKAAYVKANLTNSKEGTLCMPSVRGVLDILSDGEFVSKTTRLKKNVTFEPGATEDMLFDLTGLTEGEVYKFYLEGKATTNRTFAINYATADTVVYFKLMGSDLQMTTNEAGNEATLTGRFNPTVFASLASDEKISSYDLTKVEHLTGPLEAANKNALFYVDAQAGVSGTNIIVDGVAAKLDLTPGYNFEPRGDFFAQQATYHAAQAVGNFGTMLLPFDAETPEGMFARKVNEVKVSYLQEVDSCNAELKSGTPYVILTGKPVDVTAKNVSVSTQVPSEGTDTLRGTWVNLIATDTQYVLDQADTQYFNSCTGERIPALTAYLEYTRKVRATSYQYNAKDKKARQLAQAIASALSALEAYGGEARQAVKSALVAAIAESEAMLTQQPVTATQTAQLKALEEAIAALIADATRIAENGYEDRTAYIQNHSFELGSVKNWTAQSSIVNNITSSHSLFMSGADGKFVARMNSGGTLDQQLNGMENGRYQLEAMVAADYGNHITLRAGDKSVTVEATDFGPMYLSKAIISDIEVTDGTLLIGAESVEGWAKVDDFRLYIMESTDGIEKVNANDNARTQKGIYDLTGRKLNEITHRGVYIIDGRKVLK